MQVSEAESALRQFEATHDILRHQIEGWCVWPLLRLFTGYLLQGVYSPVGAPMRRRQIIGSLVHDFRRLHRLRRSRYLVKSYVSGLSDQEGGRYKDIWFGDLVASLPGVLQIDGINNPAFLPRRAQARRPGDFTSAIFGAAAAVTSRLGRPVEVTRAARELTDLLQTSFGADRFPLRVVESSLHGFHAQLRIYRWVLGRVRPSHVLVADFGEYALVAAAKERGIPVLELQHGVVYGDHHGYGWSTYALPYRDRMPIPDRFLLYGEHWRGELARNGFWDASLEVVGSLRMDDYRARRAGQRRDAGKRLLVTTQGIETERVMRFLAEFLALEGARDLELIVKLHPAYEPNKETYAAILDGDERATVLLGTEGDSTFDLLCRADLHLSISSTCHYEALGLGVPTAVLPFASHEIMRHLWEDGHATILSTPSDLQALLHREATLQLDDAVSAHYFLPGALERLQSLLGVERPTSGAGPEVPLLTGSIE
jgi:hypothetical protein